VPLVKKRSGCAGCAGREAGAVASPVSRHARGYDERDLSSGDPCRFLGRNPTFDIQTIRVETLSREEVAV